MIRTVFFDLGNVLLYFDHVRMCQQMADVAGCDPERMRQILFAEGLQQEFECGRISEAQFHDRLQACCARRIPLQGLRRAAADIFTPNASIAPVVEQLKARGIRLILLSNTNCTHIDFIRERFDVLRAFDKTVLSCEVGATKPEPAIYRAALAEAKCEPSECFYTDDIERFVEAGRKHGIQAEVYTTTAALQGHLGRLGLNLP